MAAPPSTVGAERERVQAAGGWPLAAATALREEAVIPRPPVFQAEYDEQMERIRENLEEKNTLLKSIEIPEDMTFSFPLSGRIESPQFNALEAFLKALTGKATEQLMEKGKEELGKQLGDFLGLKKKPDAEGAHDRLGTFQ